MFGYIRINKMDLTFREYDHYGGYYCGLCKCLKKNYGDLSRLSLNFDVTFLVILLSSLYKPKSLITNEKCIASPFKKKKVVINEATEYCASMNLLLTHFKLKDNVVDDGGIKNKIAYNIYKKKSQKVCDKYPQKSGIMRGHLENLRDLEKSESTNIDEVSNTFANLMSEVFAYKEDEYEKELRKIGFNIGKYIYILDAFEDLDKDIKNGNYNPFVEYENKREILVEKVDKMISLSLGFLGNVIDNLNLKYNKSIIENIIYSGVFLRYKKILYNDSK